MTGNKRISHIMKRNSGSVKPPCRFIFFDTETGREKVTEEKYRLPLKLGAAIYVNTDTKSGIPEEERFEFTEIEPFWDWVISKTGYGKVVWVFAHNINFDLSVMKWHKELYMNRGWVTHGKCILPDGAPIPFVIDWKPEEDLGLDRKRTIRLCDTANYFGITSLAKMGNDVGVAKMNDIVDYKKEPDRWFNAEPGTEDWETLRTYCMRDVEVVQKAVFTFIDFVTMHQLGSFAISAAGQAKNAFTHRFMPEQSIYIHDNVAAMQLERDSYMGARVELLNRQGEFNEDIYEADINSMYPYIMATYPIPVKRIRSSGTNARKARREMPIENIIPTINAGFALIARVELDIPFGREPVVPIKRNGKLIYPTGRFEAVLCTPELKKAVSLGYVIDILNYSLYETRTDIFTSFVEFFYNKRWEYKAQGNGSFEAMCKLMLNSLYGKFGQYTYEWHSIKETDADHLAIVDFIKLQPGSIKSVVDVHKTRYMYRNIGGRLERRDTVKVEPADGFCAIASHIIAYGRAYLSELIEIAGGRQNVIYCDTDSLHLINDGVDRLAAAGMLDNRELGKLKLESHMKDTDGKSLFQENGRPVPSSKGNYRGAKDYNLEGKGNKTKGIPKYSLEIDGTGSGAFEVDQFRGFQGSLRDSDLDNIEVDKRVKRVTGKYTKAAVDPITGIVSPFHVVRERLLSPDEVFNEMLTEELSETSG